MLIQYVIISGIPKESTGEKIISNFRHTWGISKTRFSIVVRGFLSNSGDTNRKVKDDKDSSVFTCERRRKTEFTGYTEYKKRTRDWRDSHQQINAKQLMAE